MPTLITLIQHRTGGPSHSNQTKIKGIGEIQIGKEEVKLSLFADGTKLYIKNPKDTTKKPLELIDEFSISCRTINIQKSFAFLYTNNKLSEREIKETSPFKNCIKKKKIPRNKPT